MVETPDMIEKRVIAAVEMTDDATDEEKDEMVRCLDDGNDYPGFQVQVVNGTMYVTAD